jgi:DNA-binding MarR family transcriptional regulator
MPPVRSPIEPSGESGPTASVESSSARDDVSLADALPAALGPFGRLLRRAVRADFPGPPLANAQVDLLRAVQHRPGMAVWEAAEVLNVAPNTVSMLIRELVDAGLLDRYRDPGDRRTARLHLTVEAENRLADWERHRRRVMLEVLAGLRPDERAAIAAALPALARLRQLLDARAAEGSPTRSR